MLEPAWRRVLGALSHAELHFDVDATGLSSSDVRSPQPVIDRRHRYVTGGVHTQDVTVVVRVARLSPLKTTRTTVTIDSL